MIWFKASDGQTRETHKIHTYSLTSRFQSLPALPPPLHSNGLQDQCWLTLYKNQKDRTKAAPRFYRHPTKKLTKKSDSEKKMFCFYPKEFWTDETRLPVEFLLHQIPSPHVIRFLSPTPITTTSGRRHAEAWREWHTVHCSPTWSQ